MAGFVKLDCGMLESSIWFDRDVRDLFITALLMATPHEITVPTPTIATDSLEDGGMVVPPGWYGFVAAAGTGIVHRSMIDPKRGPECLKALASPEGDSRSQEFGGRRMVRINGGYLILNYIRYREKDYTSKDRSRRWRERQKAVAARDIPGHVPESHGSTVTTHRDDTQAEYRVQSTEEGRKEGRKEGPTPNEPQQKAPLSKEVAEISDLLMRLGVYDLSEEKRVAAAAALAEQQWKPNELTNLADAIKNRYPDKPERARGRITKLFSDPDDSERTRLHQRLLAKIIRK